MKIEIKEYYKNAAHLRVFNDHMKLLYLGYNLGEVILLSYITSLSMKYGYCSATDNYLSKYLNIKVRSIQGYLKHLEESNLICRYFENNERRIEVMYDKIKLYTQNIAY